MKLLGIGAIGLLMMIALTPATVSADSTKNRKILQISVNENDALSAILALHGAGAVIIGIGTPANGKVVIKFYFPGDDDLIQR